MGASKILLTMTDRPRPPQPPVNDDLEATREIVERGLRGTRRTNWAALSAVHWRKARRIRRTSNCQDNTKPQNGNTKPAKNPGNETDDD